MKFMYVRSSNTGFMICAAKRFLWLVLICICYSSISFAQDTAMILSSFVCYKNGGDAVMPDHINIDTRVNINRIMCQISFDTIHKQYYLISFRRRSVPDILSSLPLKGIKRFRNSVFQIGSYETTSGVADDSFLIAVEEWQGDFQTFDRRSKKIYRAWICNGKTGRIKRTPIHGLYRVHEGYYRTRSRCLDDILED